MLNVIYKVSKYINFPRVFGIVPLKLLLDKFL